MGREDEEAIPGARLELHRTFFHGRILVPDSYPKLTLLIVSLLETIPFFHTFLRGYFTLYHKQMYDKYSNHVLQLTLR